MPLLFAELTPSDWAAFVQAVGTIAAVALAPVLASNQHKKALVQDRIRMNRETTGRLESLIAVLDKALGYADEVIGATQSDGAARGYGLEGTPPELMEKLRADFDRIDLLTIPSPKLVTALMEVRITYPLVVSGAAAAMEVELEWQIDPDEVSDHVGRAVESLRVAREAAEALRGELARSM